MRFEQLRLQAFGGFTDRTLDFGVSDDGSSDADASPRRFHLVYGPNEAGKSTTMRAIHALLFGFPHKTSDDYVHRTGDLRVGGVIVGDQPSQTLDVVRRKGKVRTLMSADESDVVDESLLSTMIGDISADDFSTRFGLSHDELVDGGRSIVEGEGDLGEILFAAGAGIGRLREISSAIESDLKTLFTPRSTRRPTINVAIGELGELRKTLREKQVPPSRYRGLRAEMDRQNTLTKKLREQVAEASAYVDQLRRIQKALPLIPQWESARVAVAATDKVVELDDDFTSRRRDAAEALARAEDRVRSLDVQLQTLDSRIESLAPDERINTAASEIDSLYRGYQEIDKATQDRENLVRNRNRGLRRLVQLMDELDVSIDDPAEASDPAGGVSPDDSSTGDLSMGDLSMGDSPERQMERVGLALDRVGVSDTHGRKIIDLAGRHQSLVEGAQRIESEIELVQSNLKRNRAELETDPPRVPLARLEEVLAAVGSTRDLVERIDQADVAVRDANAAVDNALRSLVGFDGDADAAAAIKLPPRDVLTELVREMESAGRDADVARTRTDDVATQRRELAANRESIELSDVPSQDDLKHARARRDDVIASIKPNELDEQRSELQTQVTRADQTVDQMRLHQDRLTQIETLDRRIKRIDGELAKLQSESEASAGRIDDVQKRWTRLWADIGVTAGSVDDMREFYTNHRLFMTARAHRDEALAAADRIIDAAGRTRDELDAAIRQTSVSGHQSIDSPASNVSASNVSASNVSASNPSVPIGGSGDHRLSTREQLPRLYARAGKIAGELRERVSRWEEMDRDVKRDEFVLEELKQKQRVASESLGKWQNDWSRLTEALGAGEHPAVVVEKLSQISRGVEMKKETNILFGRIASITRDERDFIRQVRRLSIAIDQPIADDAGMDEAIALATRAFRKLEEEKANRRTRVELENERRSTLSLLVDAKATRRDSTALLETLAREAKADDIGDLPELERRARERRTAQEDLRRINSQLRVLAGSNDLEGFVQTASERTESELVLEIDESEAQVAAYRERYDDAHQTLGRLNAEFALMDGSDGAGAISQRMQMVIGDIDRDARRYASLKVATRVLRTAIEHYRDENQSPVLALARDAFSRMTAGKYQSLKMDFDQRDRTILVAVPADGSSPVPANQLSTGTADALYLAMRIASLEHQIKTSTVLPLIVDDCLVQLDEHRCVAALKLLSDLSMQTQVILFTHHQNLVDLAGEHLPAGHFVSHNLIAG